MIYNGKTDNPVRDADLYALEQEAKEMDWKRLIAKKCCICGKVIEEGEWHWDVYDGDEEGIFCKPCVVGQLKKAREILDKDFVNAIDDGMDTYTEFARY